MITQHFIFLQLQKKGTLTGCMCVQFLKKIIIQVGNTKRARKTATTKQADLSKILDNKLWGKEKNANFLFVNIVKKKKKIG